MQILKKCNECQWSWIAYLFSEAYCETNPRPSHLSFICADCGIACAEVIYRDLAEPAKIKIQTWEDVRTGKAYSAVVFNNGSDTITLYRQVESFETVEVSLEALDRILLAKYDEKHGLDRVSSGRVDVIMTAAKEFRRILKEIPTSYASRGAAVDTSDGGRPGQGSA